ncbi:restriction endonuclease subunit S [Pseudomonas sp. A-1]|uniref:restriction endonuclease subunit S n=1 Tax=Pseudomonas sp. A-1 TaxID=1821274 RepID=UPI0010A5F076|nr:restriction endonuclease subunit S [Pseudomonas sp. A-1]THG87125.1 restriction endonuclease subunit S [Pseudomonas sp. A-1]
MTALLTDNLPLLAGAPNGIKKLRELILELAVRGKLVPQDPSDEPASELLKRITEEKARLVAEGRIRKQKPLAEIGEEEKSFELPAGWGWTRLGSQVVESGAGWSPSCEPRPREGSEWGVLKVSAVSWGVYQPEENKALPASLEARPEHEVAEGDFLVSRANTAELVARSVVVETTPSHLMLSDKIVRLKLTSLCERRYVNLANSAPLARYYYSQVAGGTSSSMKNVSREQILSLPIALPPLAEQQRIVAKVDELMALCDRLEARQADAASAHARLVQALLDSLTQASAADDFAASWQRLVEHFHSLFTSESSIDALKQTLLQLAVMGKLVPQDPNDEPAGESGVKFSTVNERLVEDGKIKVKKPLDAVEEVDKPFELPLGWVWQWLPDISFFQEGPGIMAKDFRSSGVPLIRISGMHGPLVSLNGCNFLEEDMVESKWSHFRLELGDIVLSSSASLGKVAKVGGAAVGSVAYTGLIRFKVFDFIFDEYLIRFLGSGEFARQIENNKRGAAISHFGPTHLRKMIVPVPPFMEQKRIVAKLDELFALCDQLKARLTAARQLHERLVGALVEQAVA